MILRRIVIGFFCLFFASSCAHRAHTDKSIQAAKNSGFETKLIDTQWFKITTFEKISDPNQPIVFYIEGDGHSMASRYRLSTDPTPHQPLALDLAVKDHRPNVVYIARPCQYTPHQIDGKCEAKYWSTHRFAEEVIQSTNDVVSHYTNKRLRKSTQQGVNLVGFSGGAGVAVLVASLRNDVDSLTTVAGDLNIRLMESIHQTTPQTGSLDPLDFASKLNIKQLHLSGANDTVVPQKVAQSFVALSQSRCTKHLIVEGNSHHQGWKNQWPDLLDNMPCHAS